MQINQEKCVSCEACIPYCPVNAIKNIGDRTIINFEDCVECSICVHADVCPTDALEQISLNEYRRIRQAFSDPLISHADTAVPGRGTEEMKTNEVTGRFKRGRAGVAIEMGRPGVGTSFADVEKMTTICAQYDVVFEKNNPLTSLMRDKTKGEFRKDILNEKVLSAIIEFEVSLNNLEGVLTGIREAANTIDTVFSLDLASKVEPDGSVPALNIARNTGFTPSINGKVNVGLGKPKVL